MICESVYLGSTLEGLGEYVVNQPTELPHPRHVNRDCDILPSS